MTTWFSEKTSWFIVWSIPALPPSKWRR